MATNTETCLNKLVLNNFVVQSRPLVRQGKLHVINKVVRRVRQLRQQKATNEKDKEKFLRKADKMLEELPVLKNFHPDEMMKFALLNKKSLVEVTNDPSSLVDERALCRVANWKTVAPEVKKFREKYPDWEEKVPVLLKNMGLQYRRKRLKRIEKRGQKEKFLEREHNNLTVLQKITNIDIDPRLLAKAGQLMKASKQEDTADNSRFDRKNKGDREISKKKTKGTKSTENNTKDNEDTQMETEDPSYQRESSDDEQFHEDETVASKHPLKTQKTLSKASPTKHKTKELNKESDEIDEYCQKPKTKGNMNLGSQNKESEDEGISGDESREHESEDQITSDEDSDRFNHIKQSKHKLVEESITEEQDMLSDEEDVSHSDNESETENEYSDPNSDSDNQEDSVENKPGTLKRKKQKQLKEVYNSDSEGISGDESGTGSEYEITSIWESYKNGEESKPKKKTKIKTLKSDDVKKMVSGNNVSKRKGTVEVRQLNLADQDSIDLSVKENEEEVSSDSEEDFFIRDPVDKDKKNVKAKSRTNVMKFESDAEDNEAPSDKGDEIDSDDKAVSRERYLDNNFKRIWGMGTEETIKSAGGRGRGFRGMGDRGFHGMGDRGFRGMGDRGFRGMGDRGFRGMGDRGFRGMGNRGFHDTRGGGFRGRKAGNPNMMPLGMDTSNVDQVNNNYSNPNSDPVSSDWRNKRHTNFKDMGETNHTEQEDRNSWKWKQGRFDRYENKPGMPYGSSGSRRGEFSRGRGQSRPFGRRDQSNANLGPVTGNFRNHPTPGSRDSTRPSLLHPSWLAKQKEKQQASGIHQFQGKVMKFD